jgi:glycosyltransferase involved in cell wall biosynthesis
VRLTIIGDGPERDNLEDLVDHLDLRAEVAFAGALPYDRAMSRLVDSDFYIVFNDLSTMGNQIHEAIVLGLIPVTLDDGSTDSILRNGYNAIKFPVKDNFASSAAESFCADYLADPSRLARLLTNLKSTRSKVFTWEERNAIEQEFLFRIASGQRKAH